jgi:hypothetical protein
LVVDDKVLRRQWRYWFEHEMAWLDREAIPLYHTTGNHTAYDTASESVFREALAHLPQNGPARQEGLSYSVRRGDLLLVFVNTLWSGLGGDGRVETTWLDRTLADNADARYKLVLGHHPVYPVNGFSGDYQRHLGPENGRAFWQVLVRHDVLAYLCSHIMAFDVQVRQGVLQIVTAGAGTMPQMPQDLEYLHCVQAALDSGGLRYQVLDTSGRVREWLAWPIRLPPCARWTPFACGEQPIPALDDDERDGRAAWLAAWRFEGICSSSNGGAPQTLLCGWMPSSATSPLWIGLRGAEQRLCVLMSAAPGRSPHFWLGPTLSADEPFSVQVAIHSGMGPGGFLWRWGDADPWSSLSGASPWGAERLAWPAQWGVGCGRRGPDDRPFRGRDLKATWHTKAMALEW